MFIHKVCQALNTAKVSYAIVGGYAVALHGIIRGTVDIDLVINWKLDNLLKVEVILKNLGLVSRLPLDAKNVFLFREEYINNRNLIAWNFYDPLNAVNQVDIIINYDLKGAKTKTVNDGQTKIQILSKNDLIAMKKSSGRPQDLVDIEALENL